MVRCRSGSVQGGFVIGMGFSLKVCLPGFASLRVSGVLGGVGVNSGLNGVLWAISWPLGFDMSDFD